MNSLRERFVMRQSAYTACSRTRRATRTTYMSRTGQDEMTFYKCWRAIICALSRNRNALSMQVAITSTIWRKWRHSWCRIWVTRSRTWRQLRLMTSCPARGWGCSSCRCTVSSSCSECPATRWWSTSSVVKSHYRRPPTCSLPTWPSRTSWCVYSQCRSRLSLAYSATGSSAGYVCHCMAIYFWPFSMILLTDSKLIFLGNFNKGS